MARTRVASSRTSFKWPKGPPLGAVLAGGLALIVALAPDLLGVLNPRAEVAGSARALGYNALVDKLVVARGWLEMRSTATGYQVVETALAPTDRTATDLPADLADVWTRFKRQSYLSEDIGDPGRWIVSDYGRDASGGAALEIVGIDPSAHQVAGPFSAPDAWRGALLYRTGAQASVGLVRRTAASTTTRLTPEPMRFAPGGGTATLRLFTPPAPLTVVPWRYVFTAPGCAGPIAGLMRISTDSVSDGLVRLPPRDCAVTVKIAGRVERSEANTVRYVRIGIGQALTFERVGSNGRIQRETFDYAAPLRAVSPAPGPGQARRRARGLESFARGVEGLMASKPTYGDVRTTLDPNLQAAAEAALNEAGPLLNAAGRPGRAAVTVMDANTGEVLAVATRPLPPTEPLSFLREGLDDRNHNFTAMAIGSVAKGPLTMAILQTWPVLAGLQIAARGDFDGVVGVAASFRDTADGGVLNVVSFLARSSNRFAVGLMLLALGDDPAVPDPALGDTPDCYDIASARACRPPHIQTLQPTAPAGPNGYVLRGKTGGVAWGPTLASLFDAPTEFEDGRPDAGAGIWTGLVNPGDAPPGGAPVYLEMGNLGLNDIVDVRQDYLMSMLGGSRLRWPSIKVAEMFSRMVTRRPVEARLVYAPRPREFAPVAPTHPAEWNLVLQGLEAVAGRHPVLGGTAGSLRPSIPEGPYRMFAKTGTPTLDISSEAAPAEQAVVRLARRGCGLTWDPQSKRILVPADLRPACRQIASQAGPRNALNAAVVVMSRAYADRMDADTLADSHPVTDLSADARSVGYGHGIALVIGRYPAEVAAAAGEPDVPPDRALTIVVNLESHEGDRPATDLAGRMLRSGAVRGWLAYVPPETAPTGARR